jgi:beta-glucuronidase
MTRQVVSLHHRWRFCVDENNRGINDEWFRRGIPVYREVTIPHTYSIEPGTENYNGPVWYEYNLDYCENYSGKLLRLQCNGIYRDADFWLNGESVGRHYGSGYTAFFVNLPELKKNSPNVLRIRVQKPYTLDALPQDRHFDWADDGGIIREIFLVVTDPCAIDHVQIFAKPEIRALGERVFKANAAFSAAVSFIAPVNSPTPLKLSYTIAKLDRENTAVIYESADYHVSDASQFMLPEINLKDVDLWHFDSPHLYELRLTLTGREGSTDEISNTFGFREFTVRDGRFTLNGEFVRLAGTEWMPGSNPEYGNAEPKEYIYKILTQLKNMNCVFTRFHWQQDEALFDWCDKNGMLLQEEIPNWGNHPLLPGPLEMDISRAQAKEMVFSHCNHPSIISWGMGNELQGQAAETMVFMKSLKSYFLNIDPARLVSYVTNTIWADPGKDAAAAGDILMVNDYWESNFGAGDSGDALKKIAAAHPEKPLVISEFGLWEREPAFQGNDPGRIALFRKKLDIYRENPAIGGVIYFCLNDYRTQFQAPYGKRAEMGVGKLQRRIHGSTDMFGEPKPSYYVVRDHFSPLWITRIDTGKSLIELYCANDIPAYTAEGYYVEYKNAEGISIHKEQLPVIKPGNSVEITHSLENVKVIRVCRPGGNIAVNNELDAAVRIR